MKLSDLEPEEEVVLLGLLREVITADGKYTDGERTRVEKISTALGEARFDRAMATAKARYASRDVLKEHAKRLARPAARAAIFSALAEVAEAEGVAESERKPLNWLASWWGLG